MDEAVNSCTWERLSKFISGRGGQSFRGDPLERTTGIEPALSAWEADVMPFHYVRARDESLVLSIANRR